jgi:hypothetical protein
MVIVQRSEWNGKIIRQEDKITEGYSKERKAGR